MLLACVTGPSGLRRCILLPAALLACIQVSGASADVYKRVGPDGQVTWSNLPQGPGDPAETRADPGSRPRRRLRIESIAYDLPGQPGSILELGTIGTGATCLTREALRVNRPLLEDFRQLATPFEDLAVKKGHARYRSQSFGIASEEIEVVARIVKLDVRQCILPSRSRGSPILIYGNSALGVDPPRARNQVKIEVEWKVYDGRRDPEMVLHTHGMHRGRRDGREATARGLLFDIRLAFMEAGEALLVNGEFDRLARSSRAETEALPAAPAPTAPPRLELSWPRGDEPTFSKRVRDLKAATATIRLREGHGSAFLIDPRHLITNDHVVRGVSQVRVVLGRKELDGRVVSRNRHRDVALLEIAGDHGVAPLTLAPSSVETGETVYLIGTPLDESFSQTVTRGILSAERKLQSKRFYQTDAAVNHGNSGGPAFDEAGNVVGLAVAGVFTRDGGTMNINFLIPIEDALTGLGVSLPPQAE